MFLLKKMKLKRQSPINQNSYFKSNSKHKYLSAQMHLRRYVRHFVAFASCQFNPQIFKNINTQNNSALKSYSNYLKYFHHNNNKF